MKSNPQLSVLPEGWLWKTIGEIGKTLTGTTPSKKDVSNYGNYLPFVKPPELRNGPITNAQDNLSKEGVKHAKVLPSNSILVSCIGNLGKTGINSVPVAFNQQINAITINDRATILPKFVFYFFQSSFAKKALEEMASATTVTIVNKSKFDRIPIPLPPLDEQQRIVARIEELFTRLDAGVAALEAVRAQVKRYRQAVLQAAVRGLLTREWREKNSTILEPVDALVSEIVRKKNQKKFSIVDEDEVYELPKYWTWVTAGQICDCIVPNRDKPKSFCGEIPWIKLPDFDDQVEISQSASGMGLSEHEVLAYRAKVIPKGSVVMSCIGRFGITAVLKKDAVINQQLHAFLVPDQINSKYLAYAIRTQTKYMEEISTATTIAYLNKENCNSVPIALPPKNEQDKIVEEIERRFSVADQVEGTINLSIRQSARLRQSILQRAFTGKL